MGRTRGQVSQIYHTRMQALLDKINKDKQAQIDRDVAAAQKRDKTYRDISDGLTIANLTKDLREWRQGKLLKVEFDKAKKTQFGEEKQLKYKLKGDRPLKEVLTPKGALESFKRLTPKGALEERPEFTEFKAKEELDKLLEEIGESADETFEEKSLIGWINPETGKQGTAAEYDKLTAPRQLEVVGGGKELEQFIAEEEAFLFDDPGAGTVESGAPSEKISFQDEFEKKAASSLLSDKMWLAESIEGDPTLRKQLADRFSKKELQLIRDNNLDWRRWDELTKQLPQGPKRKNVEFYEQRLQGIVDDPEGIATWNLEKGSVLDKPLKWLGDEGVPEVEMPDAKPVIPGAPSEEFIESEYTKELEEWEKDLGIGEPGVFTEEELGNMPAPAAITLPTGAPAPTDPEWGTYATPGEEALGASKLEALRNIQTTPGVAPEAPSLKYNGRFYKRDSQDLLQEMPNQELEKALKGLEELDQPLPKAIESEGVPIDLASTEGFVKPDVDIPDAKEPGLGGKAFQAAQTTKQFLDIGNILTDKEATGEQKGVAAVRGTQILAELAAKKAGQETVSQIGSKAATQFIKGKGLQEGAKLGGKAAVGATAGGVVGGYTMVTEAKEAGEAWKEEDYDEAILHGINSVSGGLQTAGAGMMLSGVGAPLGAVLYGVGTAASVISSGALFLEDLFGGGDEPEPEKPKFKASQYLDAIRQSRSYY